MTQPGPAGFSRLESGLLGKSAVYGLQKHGIVLRALGGEGSVHGEKTFLSGEEKEKRLQSLTIYTEFKHNTSSHSLKPPQGKIRVQSLRSAHRIKIT